MIFTGSILGSTSRKPGGIPPSTTTTSSSTSTTTSTSPTTTSTSSTSTTTTSTSSTTTTTTTQAFASPFELVISLGGTDFVQSSPETSPVSGRYWNNTNKTPNSETGTFISNMRDINNNTLTGVNFRAIVSPTVSASDGNTDSTIYPTNAIKSAYPAPSAGTTMQFAVDLPAGVYEVYLVSSSTTTALRTNLTVRPNGIGTTSEGTIVANTGNGHNTEYEFSNEGAGIVLNTPGFIRIDYNRNTSGGGNFGRLNIIRIVNRGS